MSEQVLQSAEQLIEKFILELTEIEGLDSEVVALIQGLHKAGRLDTGNLLTSLASQRKAWEHDQAA